MKEHSIIILFVSIFVAFLNFVAAVDYRGPGFMTHDEEDEIETRMLMREQLRQSYKSVSPPRADVAETANNVRIKHINLM